MSAKLLGRIARFSTRRPWLVVGAWVLVVFVLAGQGRNLSKELSVHPLFIDGTGTKRAHEIALREFGSDYAMIVMLRGPEAAVEHQGRKLASRLEAMPRMLVVSPWAGGGAVDGLNPSPDVAALVVRVEGSEKEGVSGVLPPVRRQVDASVTSPVRASIAGFPAVIDSMRKAGDQAARLGELIAIPLLLIVLLLVFRSVIAAIIPVVVGGTVVAATQGILSLVQGLVQLDLFALSMVGMLGLALGVDYSLLVVSRFREERQDADVVEAAQATVLATSRSVIPAGCGLILAMLASAYLLAGSIAHSVAVAVITATLLSMLSAICIVPAVLTLLGPKLDRWALPIRQGTLGAPLRWSRRLLGHPRAVIAIIFGLIFCAGWAFSLDSGAASVDFLPAGDSGRRQQEDVQKALGPGWVAPMEVVIDGAGSPVTSPERLRALAAFQRQVEGDPGVQTMAGVSGIARAANRIDGIEAQLAKQEDGLDRLQTGIARAHRGATLNTSGLSAAATGSSKLDSALGTANDGAGVLADALDAASGGSEQLTQGLGRAGEGSGKLAQATTEVSTGVGRLAEALEKAQEKNEETAGSGRLLENAMHSGEDRLSELHEPLRATEERLATAWQALQGMTAGRSDPEYAAVQAAIEEADLHLTGTDIRSGEQADPSFAGVDAGVERAAGQFGVGLYLAAQQDKSGRQASKGLKKLARVSAKLDRGLGQLAASGRQLSDGIGQLSRGGEQISPVLQRLGQGAEHLAGGLTLLQTGAGRLAGGLGSGAQKSKLLSSGLGRIQDGLEGQGGSGLAQLQRNSPGLFKSAYFVLAALDGSRPERRTQVGSLINLDRGGMDARMLIVPHDEPTSPAAEETRERLEGNAEDLARTTGTEVVIGGVAPGEIDVNNSIRDGAPMMRFALSLISLFVLIPVMRSLTIPILAALINLITVSASFGVLSLLFDGSLLGGPGYVDAMVIPGTMMVMFGLAIDYEVFVFARIREEYVRTGSTSAAVSNGLDRTAHVVTGAAIIMISIFLAFSVSDFMSIRNFGVAQAVAIFIDAFIVRLIIVPAMMGWLGKWSWWMPAWLDRLLPGGTAVAAGPDRPETA